MSRSAVRVRSGRVELANMGRQVRSARVRRGLMTWPPKQNPVNGGRRGPTGVHGITDPITTNRRSQVRVLQSAPVTPPIEVCAKPHPTIHCPGMKIGIGRGLELLFEDGCLRNGVSQWRNRLREIEGSAASCFFENGEDKTFRKERIARALVRSYCHADVSGVAFFPAEVRVPWGSAGQVYCSQIFLA